MALVFSTQIVSTISFQSRFGGAGNRSVMFLRRLALLGGLWFWSFPFLVLLASVFAHYLRHRLVTGGVLLLQTTSLVLLVRQVASKTSTWAKASSHAVGGVLAS